jgi:hypothetical protein
LWLPNFWESSVIIDRRCLAMICPHKCISSKPKNANPWKQLSNENGDRPLSPFPWN